MRFDATPRADYLTIVPARSITVVKAVTPREIERAYAIRRRVFIEEQGVPEEVEMDEDDANAFHALALEDGQAVGCGRMVAHGDEAKIGRMAVISDRRRQGIGRRLLEFLIEAARQHGIRKLVLHAQLHAEGFYRRNGFHPAGEVFEEAGIPHRRMERSL